MAKFVNISYAGGRPLLQFDEVVPLEVAAKFIEHVYQKHLTETKCVKAKVRSGDMNVDAPKGRAYGFFVDDPDVKSAIFEIVGGKEDSTEYVLYFTKHNQKVLGNYGTDMQPFYNVLEKDINEIINE